MSSNNSIQLIEPKLPQQKSIKNNFLNGFLQGFTSPVNLFQVKKQKNYQKTEYLSLPPKDILLNLRNDWLKLGQDFYTAIDNEQNKAK